ncbi:MAG: ISL3 family transposase [Gemmatimonadota bacterium]
MWLKRAARRTPKDRVAIAAFRKAGLKVGRAWAIKEAIGKLWDYRSTAWARKYFDRWYYWATHSQLPSIIRAAKTMKRYLTGTLAYLKHPCTNALAESLNAQIQLMKYRARGYRNRANFALAILFHCGQLDMDPR